MGDDNAVDMAMHQHHFVVFDPIFVAFSFGRPLKFLLRHRAWFRRS